MTWGCNGRCGIARFPDTLETLRVGTYSDKHPASSESGMGLPSKFEWKMLLLLYGGYVRELAAASYPHIHGGSGDFPSIAGGACGERRLT